MLRYLCKQIAYRIYIAHTDPEASHPLFFMGLILYHPEKGASSSFHGIRFLAICIRQVEQPLALWVLQSWILSLMQQITSDYWRVSCCSQYSLLPATVQFSKQACWDFSSPHWAIGTELILTREWEPLDFGVLHAETKVVGSRRFHGDSRELDLDLDWLVLLNYFHAWCHHYTMPYFYL